MLGFPGGFGRVVGGGEADLEVNGALVDCHDVARGDDADVAGVLRAAAGVFHAEAVEDVDERPVFLGVECRFCCVGERLHRDFCAHVVEAVRVGAAGMDEAFAGAACEAERDVLDVAAERGQVVQLEAVDGDECVVVVEAAARPRVC